MPKKTLRLLIVLSYKFHSQFQDYKLTSIRLDKMTTAEKHYKYIPEKYYTNTKQLVVTPESIHW